MAKFDLDIINFNRDSTMPFHKLLLNTLKATSKNFIQQGWDFFQTLLDNLPFKQSKLLLHLCSTS